MWTKFERNVIKAVTLQPLNEANCFPDVSRELKGDHAQIISVVCGDLVYPAVNFFTHLCVCNRR